MGERGRGGREWKRGREEKKGIAHCCDFDGSASLKPRGVHRISFH